MNSKGLHTTMGTIYRSPVMADEVYSCARSKQIVTIVKRTQ